jgi:desulfoferrodoxin (superoxide reductase-like protein)
MRRIRLIPIIVLLLSIQVVFADVPTVTSIEVEAVTEGSTVTVTVRHSGPSSTHYVSKIEIRSGDDVQEFKLDPQSDTIFTEELSVAASSVVEVRAYCILHGWSGWVSSSGEEPDTIVDETGSGIPGYPLASIGLGLVLASIRRRDW